MKPSVRLFLALPLTLLALGVAGCDDHTPTELERVHQLNIIPATAILEEPGDQIQLGASVVDQVGGAILNMPVEWSSSDPSIATVSESGLVTAVASGTAVIHAEVPGTRAENTSAIVVR